MVLTDAPNIRTYHGKVVGEENSQVAITICDNILTGIVDVNDNAYYIDLTKYMSNEKNIHVIYRAEAIEFYLTEGLVNDTDGDGVNSISSLSVSSTPVATSRSVTEIEILPCYDRDFKDLYGSYTAAEEKIADMLNVANVDLYEHGVELTFDYYKKYSYLDTGTFQEIINFFKADILTYRDFTNSDLATLFYGQDFEDTYLGRGSAYNESSKAAYSVLQMVPGTGAYGASYSEQVIVLTHEIGHNLDATHDEHYEWEDGYYYSTVMSPKVYFNDTHRVLVEFSDIDNHGSATCNNGANIEACKSTVAAFR